MAVFTPADLSGLVVDDCDPTPTITFSDAAGSQPADGTGDGSTSPDIVVSAGSVCLRSERAGASLAGRTYSVTVTATDSAGNSTSQVVQVEVPHDQGHASCSLTINPNEAVASDVRCVPVSTTDPDPQGCALVPAGRSVPPITLCSLWLVLAFVLRKRTQR